MRVALLRAQTARHAFQVHALVFSCCLRVEAAFHLAFSYHASSLASRGPSRHPLGPSSIVQYMYEPSLPSGPANCRTLSGLRETAKSGLPSPRKSMQSSPQIATDTVKKHSEYLSASNDPLFSPVAPPFSPPVVPFFASPSRHCRTLITLSIFSYFNFGERLKHRSFSLVFPISTERPARGGATTTGRLDLSFPPLCAK